MDTPFQPYSATSSSFTPSAPQTPPEKIGKFKASHLIARASWNLLKQDKEMMLFPLISSIVSMVVAALLIAGYFVIVSGGDLERLKTLLDSSSTEQMSGIAEYIFVFVFYVATYFIVIYFQAGVVAIAHARMQGRDLTFGDGMRAASAHAGKLFVWSLISATVGIVLRAIAERSKLLGRIVVSLLGAAWSILTYFMLPILMLEELSLRDSLSKSGASIKRTWGETAIVNIGVGLYIFVLMLIGFAVFLGALVTGSTPVIILAGVLLVIYLLVLTFISSTLSIIFKVVLYKYASEGVLPEGFSEAVLRSAFTSK